MCIHDQCSKLNTHIAFEIKIFENEIQKFQHHVLIFEMIHVDITYRLYVIIDIIFNSINHNNNCDHVRIVMINVNRHFIMHFCFSNSSNVKDRVWLEE